MEKKNMVNLLSGGMSVTNPEAMQRQAIGRLLHSRSPVVAEAFQSPGRITELLRSYMQKLKDDGKMLGLKDVKKLDILDTTGFLMPPDNGHGMPGLSAAGGEEQAAIERLGLYACIPCFEKGAVKFNKFRYVVFEVLEVDPEKQTVKIALQDYMKPDRSFWQMGVGTTAVFSFAPVTDRAGQKHFVQIGLEERRDFDSLYTMYDAGQLGWTKSDWELWKNTVVDNSVYAGAQIMMQTGSDRCSQLATAFTLVISRCNAMLDMNKPTRPVKASTGAKRAVSYEKGSAPKTRIRYVGALRVQSEGVPRRPCLETVVTYKVARWTVRGHVRRYRDGREVYVKPCTRTRKALAETGEATATTIRFRKKKEKEL